MFFCNKNVCSILNTVYQIFNVVTKNRCQLWRHTFKKSQKYLYNCKNLKKTFLQLRCSNVLLHLKYKLPLCKPEIEFKNQTGAKALATDHRVLVLLNQKNSNHVNFDHRRLGLQNATKENKPVGHLHHLYFIKLI